MAARFLVGDRVRVRAAFPPTPPAHVRTPFYIRGHAGVVERICGIFDNPEELAFGRFGDRQTLYRVRFRMSDLWSGDGESGASGESESGGESGESDKDTIEVELYEFWLTPEGEGGTI